VGVVNASVHNTIKTPVLNRSSNMSYSSPSIEDEKELFKKSDDEIFIIKQHEESDKFDNETGEILYEYELKSLSSVFYSYKFYGFAALMFIGNICGSFFSYDYKSFGGR